MSACSYGITHTLDQVFEAPHVIKLALVDQAGINSTFVGTAYVTYRCFLCAEPLLWGLHLLHPYGFGRLVQT